MYSISDPSTQVPASSFLSLLQQGSTESNSADVGHSFLNLNEIPGFSSTESSLMETPFLPKFGVPDENGNFAENSSLVHNLLMNNSFRNAGLMGPDFPDTPGADLPDHLPGDALNYHDLTNDLISQLSRDRDDQSVFTFPDLANTPSSHFEMDTDMTNMPICSTAFLNSAPAMFSSMTGSAEDQTSFMETPPTTPNLDFAPTTELSAEQRPLAYKPRSRLGGVSTLMETINEEDLEGLDIDFDEIIPRPGAILEPSEGRMTSEDNNLNVFCENDLAEAKATSTLKTPDGEALGDDEDVFFEDGLLNNEAQLILKTPGIRAQNDGLKVFYEAASTVKPEPDTTPENVYPRLREAWLRCQGSRSLEPLLKEEIRLKIMKRRLDNGEEELSVDPPQTPEYQVSEKCGLWYCFVIVMVYFQLCLFRDYNY